MNLQLDGTSLMQAYQVFDFYAWGGKPGVACLCGILHEKIEEEKAKGMYVILLAHWGVDYDPVQSIQRNYAEEFIENGVDLIIGHGSHMMLKIEQINGKWVIYGIGNGVFNSNGEYERRKVIPYSFFTQLHIAGFSPASI